VVVWASEAGCGQQRDDKLFYFHGMLSFCQIFIFR
jgi:hypothetical protein